MLASVSNFKDKNSMSQSLNGNIFLGKKLLGLLHISNKLSLSFFLNPLSKASSSIFIVLLCVSLVHNLLFKSTCEGTVKKHGLFWEYWNLIQRRIIHRINGTWVRWWICRYLDFIIYVQIPRFVTVYSAFHVFHTP